MISNGEDIDVLMSDIESDVSITNQVNQVTLPIQELKVNEDVASANDRKRRMNQKVEIQKITYIID